MGDLSLEKSIFMYFRDWLPIAGGFRNTKNIVNNEIVEAKKNLKYAVNRFNNADPDKIASCISEINSCVEKLNKLIKEAKNDPLEVAAYQ